MILMIIIIKPNSRQIEPPYFLPPAAWPARRAKVWNVTACTMRSGEKSTAMTTPKLRPSEEPEDSAFFSAFGASAFGASAFLEPKDGTLKDGNDGALKDGMDGALMDGADGAANDFAGFAGLEFALACCAAKSSAATSDAAATWVTSIAAFAIGVAAIVSASTAAQACSLEFARATPEERRASPRAARATAVVFVVVETRAIMFVSCERALVRGADA